MFKSNVSRAQSCPCRSEVAMRYNTAPMVDVYVFRGDGANEQFEPLGTYHGFRYTSVEYVHVCINNPKSDMDKLVAD